MKSTNSLMLPLLYFLLCTSGVSSRLESNSRNHALTNRHNNRMRESPSTSTDVTFTPVIAVSSINLILNVLRPDASIAWQARFPRILWEVCIATVSSFAGPSRPSTCLLLSLMLVPTALIDIFIWAPGFALFAEFETCTGGGFFSRQPEVCTPDYVKGIGRLFVTVQSILTGLVYLSAAIISWGIFADARDSKIAKQNANALSDVMNDKWRNQ